MNDAPKALRYAEALASAEARIVAALPKILDAMIARAEAGDMRTAAYLCDRIMGRTAGAATAPADDREPPYNEESSRLDRAGREPEYARPRIIIPDADPRPSGAPEEV